MTPDLITTDLRSPSRAGGSPFRAANEFYPTPPEATRALLSAETFDGGIWEPACGQGHIAKVLEANGHDVVATDKYDYQYGRTGIDFLTTVFPRAKHIVTNPPYGFGLADAFVRKALALTAITGGKVAMLLNVTSLCHPDRHDSFVKRPPARVYALDRTVCYPNGQKSQATRHTYDHRYAWLIWEPASDQPVSTHLQWISTAPFTDAAIRRHNQQTERTMS